MFDTLYAYFDFQEVDSLIPGKILLKMLLQISYVQCLKHRKMFFGAPTHGTQYILLL
jgi:hypothetical protein